MLLERKRNAASFTHALHLCNDFLHSLFQPLQENMICSNFFLLNKKKEIKNWSVGVGCFYFFFFFFFSLTGLEKE